LCRYIYLKLFNLQKTQKHFIMVQTSQGVKELSWYLNYRQACNVFCKICINHLQNDGKKINIRTENLWSIIHHKRRRVDTIIESKRNAVFSANKPDKNPGSAIGQSLLSFFVMCKICFFIMQKVQTKIILKKYFLQNLSLSMTYFT